MPTQSTARKRHKTRQPGVYYRLDRAGKRAYEVSYRDQDGRQHWQRVHGDQEAAAAALADIKRKLRHGESVRPDARTLHHLYEEWGSAGYAGRARPRTATKYADSLGRYVLPQLGHLPVQKITTAIIVRWVRDLKAHGSRSGGPLATWTVRGALVPLRNLLDRAVDEQLIPRNPVRDLGERHMPKADERAKRILTSAELQALVEATSERFKLALKLLAATGMRASELCGLVWGDIDLTTATVTISRQLDGEGGRVELKTASAARTVPLPDALVRQLAEHKLAALASTDSDWVFVRDNGSPMPYCSFESGFRNAARRACLRDDAEKPNASLHSLRHTFASMLIAQGHDVVTISRALGHASVDITLRVYSHEFEARDDAERKRRLAAGVGQEFAAAFAG